MISKFPKDLPSLFLTVIWSCCIFSFLPSCQPADITKDIRIAIDLNIFKTFVSFRFADAQTGELIGKTDGTTVQLSFGGRDQAAVVSQTGERLDYHSSVLGMISVALDPYGPYKMVPGKSIVFNFTASAPGYSPTKAAITISKTGTQVCMVSMRKTGYADNKPQQYLIKPGEITDGLLAGGFRMITPLNLFELEVPDSVQFTGSEGERASGQLRITAIRYNRLSETAAGGNRVMKFLKEGAVTPGVLEPAGIIDLSIQCTNPAVITGLPGKPAEWRFPVDDAWQPGDSLPVWTYIPAQKIWESAGYAKIMTGDTLRMASFPIRHLSLYAAGNVVPTSTVSGVISFSFTKPFISTSFPGNILISDASTGERIQTVPVTVYSGLSFPLSIDMPVGAGAILTFQNIDADFEFSSQPSSYTVLPGQTEFSGIFNLLPLRCRLSGTVRLFFPGDFAAYPVAGILQVLDASAGNALLSKTISITFPGFSTDISLMVRESRPVQIRVIPGSLSADFLSTPALLREEIPCIENGSWNFAFDPNTCRIQTTASISLSGPVPKEPVPAEIQVLRASDRRLITRIPVSLARAVTDINVTATVPVNTPVLLTVKPTFPNRPFTSDPVELTWNNPCTTDPAPVFRITPKYAQLSGRINFTFQTGLMMDEIPVRILTYTRKNDALLSSQDFIVRRSDPAIAINQFTPAEPLYIKISRTFSYTRFSPVPFRIDIPDPAVTPESWSVVLNPTELVPVHFLVRVVCPGGEVLPTVQGYYRIPGDDWHEMNIISGSLTITIEMGLTYEVGMILGGAMIDSTFTIEKQENNLTFELEPADCKKMGWGK